MNISSLTGDISTKEKQFEAEIPGTLVFGAPGPVGEPATIVSAEITYQASDSGTIIPSGSWSSSVPPVTPGRYLWTRQVLQFNTGAPITSYSVSRFGIDGTCAVSTVAGVAPDETGNVPLDASSVKALAITGGTMEGAINMNGQALSGLNTPTKDNEAATKEYADTKCSKEEETATLTVSGWGTGLTQTVSVSGVTASNTVIVAPDAASHAAYTEANVRCTGQSSGKLTFVCDEIPTATLTVNVVILT